MPSRDDLSPRGRAFLDAHDCGDSDEMERLVKIETQEEWKNFYRRRRKENRILFFLVLAAFAFLALIVSRWIEL